MKWNSHIQSNLNLVQNKKKDSEDKRIKLEADRANR